jgi:hypothetical protein
MGFHSRKEEGGLAGEIADVLCGFKLLRKRKRGGKGKGG